MKKLLLTLSIAGAFALTTAYAFNGGGGKDGEKGKKHCSKKCEKKCCAKKEGKTCEYSKKKCEHKKAEGEES